ncbi:inorganic pyrophosphatase [Halorubrum aidingense JCM 13560]|uniref:Inorganic pyrophosphatase n=1 Tax=Halorubrum aidingense JCM 13560 TaxID=1230454 RepID=M0P961_9EURY|nr:inorganic diphosphatase [Halorubrum aidingense]EMA66561.1 inorganic pyrophosphatase [Halorubrum aidingense JCM 13560]
MADDRSGLSPSGPRRSFLAGVGSLAGLSTVERAAASADGEAHANHDESDPMNHDPVNLIDGVEQHDNFPKTATVVDEIPKGEQIKYEYRKEIPGFILDRALYSSVVYPGDYGFFARTAGGDGDPLDFLALTDDGLFTGCVFDLRPVAVIRMTDTGETDDKIIGVPADDPRFDHIEGRGDIPEHHQDVVEEFFRTYKNLEPDDAEVVIEGWDTRGAAYDILEEGHQKWRDLQRGNGNGKVAGENA